MKLFCSDEVLKWLKEHAYVYGSYDPEEQAYFLKDMPADFVPTRLHIPLTLVLQARLKEQFSGGKE